MPISSSGTRPGVVGVAGREAGDVAVGEREEEGVAVMKGVAVTRGVAVMKGVVVMRDEDSGVVVPVAVAITGRPQTWRTPSTSPISLELLPLLQLSSNPLSEREKEGKKREREGENPRL